MNLNSIFIPNVVHRSKINTKEDIEKLLKIHNFSANYFQEELTW